jgi:hypothetical protein
MALTCSLSYRRSIPAWSLLAWIAVGSAWADEPPARCWYRVAAGDSLSLIAQRATRDVRRWPELAEVNPLLVQGGGHVIEVGDELLLPESWGRAIATRCVEAVEEVVAQPAAPVEEPVRRRVPPPVRREPPTEPVEVGSVVRDQARTRITRASAIAARQDDPYATEFDGDPDFFARLVGAERALQEALARWFPLAPVDAAEDWPAHTRRIGGPGAPRRFGPACASSVALDPEDAAPGEIVGDPADPWTCLQVVRAGPIGPLPEPEVATALAGRFAELRKEVGSVQAPIGQDRWAGLLWRSAVAEALAALGSTPGELGGRSELALHAAQVSRTLVGEADLPDPLRAWLYLADLEVRSMPRVPVEVALPPRTLLSFDGAAWLQGPLQGQVELVVGQHRLTVQRGEESPVSLMLEVRAGEALRVEVDPLPGARELPIDLPVSAPSEPDIALVEPEEDRRGSWRGHAVGQGLWNLGRAVVGVELGGRYVHVVTAAEHGPSLGAQLALAMYVPVLPYQVDRGQLLRVFGRASLGLVIEGSWRRGSAGVVLGGYADPRLSAGPLGAVQIELGAGRATCRLQAQLGWDATPHVGGIARWTVGGGLGVGF